MTWLIYDDIVGVLDLIWRFHENVSMKPGFIIPTPTLPGPDLGEYKLKVHPKYKNMFYIRFPDGTLSEDFYNKTRATDNAVRLHRK